MLVADNDERVRRSAHQILGAKFGCIVETARDGKEAITMARLGSYDIILTDIRLPDMTGHDVFCQLRAAQPMARVFLMTAFGYDPTHSIVKCRQEGLRQRALQTFPRRSTRGCIGKRGFAPTRHRAASGGARDKMTASS